MEAITSGITAIMGVATTMLDTITSNAIFAALFAAGFVGVGLSIIRKVKKTAMR